MRKDKTSGKFNPRSDKYFFVGYPKETMGYYFFHRGENKVIVARHGVFLEKEFLARKSSGSNVRLEEIQVELQDGNPRVPPRVAGVSGSFLSPDPSRMEEAEDIPAATQVNTPSTPVEDVQARVDEEVPLQDVSGTQLEEASQRVVRQPERWLGLHEVTSLGNDDPVSFDDAMSRPDSDS